MESDVHVVIDAELLLGHVHLYKPESA